MAAGAAAIGFAFDTNIVREVSAIGVVLACMVALVVSWQRRKAGVLHQREQQQSRSQRVAEMTGIDRDRQEFDETVPEFPPNLDLLAPSIGLIGLVAAGLDAGSPAWLQLARVLIGAAFLGCVTD